MSRDAQQALMERLGSVPDPESDPEARRLMAQVTLAKATGFLILLLPDGCLLDVTESSLTAGGLDRAEVIGFPLWDTPWCAHDDAVRREVRVAVSSVANGRIGRFDIDLMVGMGGTTPETVDLVLRPLRGEDGRVALILAEGRQVSDRRRAEERIALQNQELSVLTERLAGIHDHRQRLLNELSHDLRTPLQVVLTRAERLLRVTGEEESQLELQGIRLAALDALEQVDDMLEQVRREQQETRLELVEDDLALIVRSVTDQFEVLAAQYGIDLIVRMPEALTARFDPERVSRIVANLLANAVRFAQPGGAVRCSLLAGEHDAVLEVADSGAGVAPELRDHLFDRYFTQGNGIGLGLAIVRDFVTLHGGTIEVGEAREGVAQFTVRLPLRTADRAAAAPGASLNQHLSAARRATWVSEHLAAELSSRSPSDVPTHRSAAVVVDGDPQRVATLVAALEPLCSVFTAADAGEAYRLAMDLAPALIVIGTPTGEAGATVLLDRLAREWRLRGVLRVALIARDDLLGRDALLAAGAHDFIAEPAAAELLRARVPLLLAHARLRARAEAAESELRRVDAAGTTRR